MDIKRFAVILDRDRERIQRDLTVDPDLFCRFPAISIIDDIRAGFIYRELHGINRLIVQTRIPRRLPNTRADLIKRSIVGKKTLHKKEKPPR